MNGIERPAVVYSINATASPMMRQRAGVEALAGGLGRAQVRMCAQMRMEVVLRSVPHVKTHSHPHDATVTCDPQFVQRKNYCVAGGTTLTWPYAHTSDTAQRPHEPRPCIIGLVKDVFQIDVDD